MKQSREVVGSWVKQDINGRHEKQERVDEVLTDRGKAGQNQEGQKEIGQDPDTGTQVGKRGVVGS